MLLSVGRIDSHQFDVHNEQCDTIIVGFILLHHAPIVASSRGFQRLTISGEHLFSPPLPDKQDPFSCKKYCHLFVSTIVTKHLAIFTYARRISVSSSSKNRMYVSYSHFSILSCSVRDGLHAPRQVFDTSNSS